MKNIAYGLAFALWLVAFPAKPQAAPIQFEDLGPAGTGILLPTNYAGLVWQNFRVLDADVEFAAYGPNGYSAAAQSSPNVAFNFLGNPATLSKPAGFDIYSLYAGAAWSDGLQLTIEAMRGANTVFTGTYTVSTAAARRIVLNLSNITALRFATAGGVFAGLNGTGTQFVLDDISLTDDGKGGGTRDVPVPAAFMLFVTALAGLSTIRRVRSV